MNLTSKTQIDRLGDRLRKGNPTEDDLQGLDEYRRSFAGAYEEVVSLVRKATQLDPTGRPAKSTTSIVEKLQRETMRLTQMQDIAGCRLVVQDIVKQDQVVSQLTGVLRGAVVVDRRIQPSHGYRAVHIIATAKGKPVEIQVRTELQHLWAQLSEKLSDVFDPDIKYGRGDQSLQVLAFGASERIAKLEIFEKDLGGHGGLLEKSSGMQSSEILAQKLSHLKDSWLQALEEVIARVESFSRKRRGD